VKYRLNNYLKGRKIMKYICNVCGFVYDEDAGCPEEGIAPGTAWENIPEDFVCPLCGVGRDGFDRETE